jgi:hypothetical protein
MYLCANLRGNGPAGNRSLSRAMRGLPARSGVTDDPIFGSIEASSAYGVPT